MRFASLLFLLGLGGCHYPYPVLAAASGMQIPLGSRAEALNEKGAKVTVVTEAPQCAFIGLATGVGGLHDEYQAKGDGDVPIYREQAIAALRNAVGERGGTHVVVDATMLWGRVERWSNVLLRGRAFRC